MKTPEFAVKTSIQNHVGTIEFSHGRFNFMNDALMEAISRETMKMDGDDSVRVILLRSEGKMFCAGANFKVEGQSFDPVNLYHHGLKLFDVTKPIVAEIQGGCVGAGLGLALAADFRIGSKESFFWANFAKLGIYPGFGLSYTLPNLVGEQRAMSMFLSAEKITGLQALKDGLLDNIAEPQDLQSETMAFARNIATCAPDVTQTLKKSIKSQQREAIREANRFEYSEQMRQFPSNQFKEGLEAAFEKRDPCFQ